MDLGHNNESAKIDSARLENLSSWIMDSHQDKGGHVRDMTKSPGVRKSKDMSFRYLFAARKQVDKGCE